jgi:hypothetical protein
MPFGASLCLSPQIHFHKAVAIPIALGHPPFLKNIFTRDRSSQNIENFAGVYRQDGTKFRDKKGGASKTKINRKEFPLVNGLR